MGLFTPRKAFQDVRPEQKWDFINLRDFKSTSCFNPFAYAYLYFSLILSCAVYGVDTFTAINLLVFNQWSSEIAPTQLISFDISKWIFSICIILSIVNLAFEHIRANRIMRRGSVAECYLDSLAVRLESVRMGNGQGWRRFLVFAELTKSKKGAEYVALFTYFSFQTWIRIIICSGPRQAVNALTLYAVATAKLNAKGTDVGNTLLDFFKKLQYLAQHNPMQQTLILSGMLFTLVIWVIGFLSLLLAVLFYIFFLWGYIPRSDGGLSGYCERKTNKRLMAIVQTKINKAMADDERKRRKAEVKAAKKTGEKTPIMARPTLPDVSDDKLAEMPSLMRTETMTTLPQYESRPGTPGGFELNSLDQKRPMASRTATQSSAATYSSRTGLLNGAAEPGYGRASPAPTLPSIDLNEYPPPARTGTAGSNRSFGGPQPYRNPSESSRLNQTFTASPASYSTAAFPAPSRQNTANSYPRPPAPGYFDGGRSTPNGSRGAFGDEFAARSASPAPSGYSSRTVQSGGPISPQGYPSRSATGPIPPRGPPGPYPPQRNLTGPIPPRHQPMGSAGSDYFSRPPTSSSGGGAYAPPSRAGTMNDADYRPSTAGSQRSQRGPPPPRPPYGGAGGGSGWSRDLEAQRSGTPSRFSE